jgi:predicted ABC-type sugar transport system permease subunit
VRHSGGCGGNCAGGNTNSAALSLTGSFQCAPKAHITSGGRLAETYLLPRRLPHFSDIGGTSIFGGRGGYAGSIIGALILTVLNGLLTLLDSPEPIKQILYRTIIFLMAAACTRLTD